ncbi:MAG: DUF2079 domain-containing protein, partial [Anaerolineales bacterium]|nr:DUF2079 domain-containing protein [Anaerolineales bacterium]
ETAVAATSAYTPHLAQRSTLYLYPWVPDDAPPLDYILIDRYLKSYPLTEIERNDAINNLMADPTYVIEKEVDGVFLFKPNGTPLPG